MAFVDRARASAQDGRAETGSYCGKKGGPRRTRTRGLLGAPYFLKVYRIRGSTLALEDQFSDTLEHEPEVNGSREMLH